MSRQLIRHGNKYGVKMKAEAPSINLIKAHIQTEIAPIVGSEQQAEDLIAYIKAKRQGERRGHVEHQYFRKVHRADRGGRHPGQEFPS